MALALSNTAFWDTDVRTMDEIGHAPFIITRVFQYGLLADIKEILRTYTPQQIKDAFHLTRGVDIKAIRLAACALDLKESDLAFSQDLTRLLQL